MAGNSLERRSQREAEIRSRVAVSNRKDIDTIEEFLLLDYPVNAGS